MYDEYFQNKGASILQLLIEFLTTVKIKIITVSKTKIITVTISKD